MSHKAPKQISSQKVLAYDLGGTKVVVAAVDSRGKIFDEIRAPVSLTHGPSGLIRQLSDLGQPLLRRHPTIKKVGVASAGPLDTDLGVLLDPTNFKTKGKSWGRVKIVPLLSKALRKTVFLENDAAASILAEKWMGYAKLTNDAIVLTLGTGVGVGVICNGSLVRSGRSQHPEGSHLIIGAKDSSAKCGCGNYGCVEAYLSGVNFCARYNRKHSTRFTSKEILILANAGNRSAKAAFAEYAEWMAVAINNYATLYGPKIVIFTGSFAASFSQFEKLTLLHLEKLLSRRRVGIDLLPKLKVSRLKNKAGLLGGAYVAMLR